jgi:putative aldouronate transport system substrate-binding protein
MKKLLSLILVLMLVLTTASVMAEGDPIVITVGRSVSAGQGYVGNDTIDDNLWYREYLNRLNIQVINEWTVMDSEYNTKLNLAIASGSIPNLLGLRDQTQLKTLVEAEMIADLSDVYEQYASEDTKAFMTGDGGLAIKDCTFDGKLYALPGMNATVYNVSLLWIRRDWLETLNLEMPKTMADVIEIARAFTNNDPDGNGKNDTYGLAFSEGLFDGTTSLMGFFNGYHAYPNHWLKQEDGSVAYGSIQPEAKIALAALAEMYQEGLIDPDFAVKDTTKVCEEVQGKKFGMLFGMNWSDYSVGTTEDPWQCWVVTPAPSVDDKEAVYSVYNSCTGYYVISAECEHPEALIEMMNMYVDIVYGDQSSADNDFITSYNEAGDRIGYSSLAVVGTLLPNAQTVHALKQLVAAVDARDEALLQGCLTETDKYLPSVKYLDEKDMTYHGQYYQYVAFKVTVEQVGMDRLMENAFSGTTETMDAKGSILNDYVKEMYTKIIMGEEPIDAFDTFVAEWNKMGGDKITEEINAIIAR